MLNVFVIFQQSLRKQTSLPLKSCRAWFSPRVTNLHKCSGFLRFFQSFRVRLGRSLKRQEVTVFFNNRSGVRVLPPVCQPLSACPPCEAAEGRSFSLVVVLVSSLCETPSAVLTCTRGAHAARAHSSTCAVLPHTHADTKLIESCRFGIDWKTS